MSELLNNPWFVGIAGGIVSGFVVFLATRWIFSDRGKREIARQVANANQEVVYSIRSCIPEGELPPLTVLENLIKATARKHNVPPVKLFDVPEICQELIKEVMDSSFISTGTKIAYCDKLTTLGSSVRKQEDDMKPSSFDRDAKGFALIMASSLGSVAALMSFATVFLDGFRTPHITVSPDFRNVLATVLVPAFMTMLGALVGLTFVTLKRRQREHRARPALDEAVENMTRSKDEIKRKYSLFERIESPKNRN